MKVTERERPASSKMYHCKIMMQNYNKICLQNVALEIMMSEKGLFRIQN